MLERGDRLRKWINLVDDGTKARGFQRVVQALEAPTATDEHAADGRNLECVGSDVGLCFPPLSL
jgi:hypothetical protein